MTWLIRHPLLLLTLNLSSLQPIQVLVVPESGLALLDLPFRAFLAWRLGKDLRHRRRPLFNRSFDNSCPDRG